jgi:hypothetical protein
MEWVVVWLCCGIGAAIIASNRGERNLTAFLVGLLLGPIGVLLALTGGKRCPHCMSKIHAAANICPKCLREIPPELATSPESKEETDETAQTKSDSRRIEPLPSLGEAVPSYEEPLPWNHWWTLAVVVFVLLIVIIKTGC